MTTEALIEFVKEYPILYDMTRSDYKDQRKKDDVWDEIGEKLGEEGATLKKKWKNIRDSYSKYLRSSKTKTGQSAQDANRYKSWQWAKQMEVFRPHMSFSKTDSNIIDVDGSERGACDTNHSQSCSEALELTEGNNIGQVTKIHARRSPVMRKRRGREEESTEVDKVFDFLKRKHSLDATEHIFLGFAKTIKSFSPTRQAVVKMKISQIIMEEEIKHAEEQSLLWESRHLSSSVSSATSE